MFSTWLVGVTSIIDTIVWGMLGIPTIDFVECMTDIIYALEHIGL